MLIKTNVLKCFCFQFYSANYVWSEEWEEYGGHEYKYFSDSSLTQVEARTKCEEEGALLASMNNEEEHNFISKRVLKQYTLSTFIGGSDEKEGKYVFM